MYALSVVTFLLFFFLLFFVCLFVSFLPLLFKKLSIFSSSCFYPQMRIPMLFSKFVCCLRCSQLMGGFSFYQEEAFQYGFNEPGIPPWTVQFMLFNLHWFLHYKATVTDSFNILSLVFCRLLGRRNRDRKYSTTCA